MFLNHIYMILYIVVMHYDEYAFAINSNVKTITPKNANTCVIGRDPISPLSINDINCIQNMYFGTADHCNTLSPTTPTIGVDPTNKPTLQPTTPKPTIVSNNFCLSGGNAVNDDSTNGYQYMGYYEYNDNESTDQRNVYTNTRTSNTGTQNAIFNYGDNNWYIGSVGVYNSYSGECNIQVSNGKDCGNNWKSVSNTVFTDIQTTTGECNIVRCQSIIVTGSRADTLNYLCEGTFEYVSDNVYKSQSKGNYYWAYNDYRGQWLCGTSINGITMSGYSGVYVQSIGTKYPILYDGITYSVEIVSDIDDDYMYIQCTGCVGTNAQCAIASKSPTPITSMPTPVPTGSTKEPTTGSPTLPTNTPTTPPPTKPTAPAPTTPSPTDSSGKSNIIIEITANLCGINTDFVNNNKNIFLDVYKNINNICDESNKDNVICSIASFAVYVCASDTTGTTRDNNVAFDDNGVSIIFQLETKNDAYKQEVLNQDLDAMFAAYETAINTEFDGVDIKVDSVSITVNTSSANGGFNLAIIGCIISGIVVAIM